LIFLGLIGISNDINPALRYKKNCWIICEQRLQAYKWKNDLKNKYRLFMYT